MFLNLEFLLIQATTPTENIDVPTLASLHEMYGDEIDMDTLEVEANVFQAIMSICRVAFFKDVYNKCEHYAHNKAAFDQPNKPLFSRKIFFYSKKS